MALQAYPVGRNDVLAYMPDFRAAGDRFLDLNASAYLRRDFGLYLEPSQVTALHLEDIAAIQRYMSELRILSRMQQSERNGTGFKNATNVERVPLTPQVHTEARIHQLMRDISGLSVVNDRALRAQFNGKVTFEELSEEAKALSGILFVLAYKQMNFSMARAVSEYAVNRLRALDVPPGAWNELGEKIDDAAGRLPWYLGEKLVSGLPNPLRLLIYGQRIGVFEDSRAYYADISAQADDLTEIDRLTRMFASRAGRQAVDRRLVSGALQDIVSSPLLHPETGALRQRNPDLSRWEYPVQRRLRFLLRCIGNVGIDGADVIQRYVDSLLLTSRKESGTTASDLLSYLDRRVGKGRLRNPTAYAQLEREATQIAYHIGRNAR